MTKRLIFLLIWVLLLTISFSALAASSGTCGSEGDNLTWNLSDDGLLTISGNGEMQDYSFWDDSRKAPWGTEIKNVIIEDGVTTIGTSAFHGCTQLADVSFSSSVEQIGNYIFTDCASLVNIELPNTVTDIGYAVFNSCENLETIKLPAYIKTLNGANLFAGCKNLVSITFPKECDQYYSLSTDSTFNGCDNITEIIIPDGSSLWRFEDYCLIDKKENALIAYLPGSKLRTFTTPTGIEQIRYGAFYENMNLSKITISEGVSSIESGAFGCSMISDIFLPRSVETIYPYFCDYYESITFHCYEESFAYGFLNGESYNVVKRADGEDIPSVNVISIPSMVINIESEVFIGTSADLYIIPSGCKTISSRAFADLRKKAKIIIPESVELIDSTAFENSSVWLITDNDYVIDFAEENGISYVFAHHRGGG